MKPVQLPALVDKVETRKDGSVKIVIETREHNDEELAKIFGYRNSEGWMLFAPNQFTDAELPKEQAQVTGKSPSQRQRNVLFVLWKQQGSGDFEAFYKEQIERHINTIKDKLEQLPNEDGGGRN